MAEILLVLLGITIGVPLAGALLVILFLPDKSWHMDEARYKGERR